jgi:hypothetical protein
MQEERRRAIRHPIAVKIAFATGYGVTRDVSGLGCLFETDVALEAGDPIDFTLIIPGVVDVKCRGSVVRSIALDDGSYSVGATIDGYAPLGKLPPDHPASSHVIVRALAEHHPEGWEWGE